MKKIFTLILTLFVCQFITGQDYKFGKVSKAELESAEHHVDTTANAAILHREHKVFFEFEHDRGFQQKVQVFERIKIYNKEGYNWATKIIKLYKGNNTSEKITAFKANTYVIEEGKVVKVKLKKDGVFEEDINDYWKSRKITMPKIEDGCIVEFKYSIESPLSQIDDINFQELIPIDNLIVKIETPEWYKYKMLLNPKARYAPKIEKKSNPRKVTISYRKEAKPGLGGTTKSQLISYDENIMFDIISSQEKDIPALVSEPYVRQLSNFQAKLILELTSVQYPQQPYKNFSTSWDKVVNTIYRGNKFGGELNKTGYYSKDVDNIISSTTDHVERAFLIYNHVKSKVKWNDYYGYNTQNGVKKAYKEGVGNSGDINLMLVSMLRYAGINANPILISTVNNGIPLFPTTQGFNFVICGLELENHVVLLDATDAYATANVMSTNLINWQGRIIRESGSSTWVNLSPKTHSKEITALNAKINDDLTIDGKVRVMLSNQFARNFRRNYNNISEEEHIKDLEDNNGEIEVSDIEVKESYNLSKPISYSYNYNLQDGIEEIGNKLYFSPLLFLASEENPFKLDTRTYPIDFVYPTSYKYNVNIMLPGGYLVESMPKSSKVNYNDTEGEFICLARQNGSMLQLTFTFNINNSLILPENYSVFKQFFQAMLDAQQEKIVLKKM